MIARLLDAVYRWLFGPTPPAETFSPSDEPPLMCYLCGQVSEDVCVCQKCDRLTCIDCQATQSAEERDRQGVLCEMCYEPGDKPAPPPPPPPKKPTPGEVVIVREGDCPYCARLAQQLRAQRRRNRTTDPNRDLE